MSLNISGLGRQPMEIGGSELTGTSHDPGAKRARDMLLALLTVAICLLDAHQLCNTLNDDMHKIDTTSCTSCTVTPSSEHPNTWHMPALRLPARNANRILTILDHSIGLDIQFDASNTDRYASSRLVGSARTESKAGSASDYEISRYASRQRRTASQVQIQFLSIVLNSSRHRRPTR